MQNTSHAVMAQRHEPADSQDDFPTPQWATRALVERVIGREAAQGAMCLEPACGRGYMARPLGEYFLRVEAFDAFPYGYAGIRDFMTFPNEVASHDWVITDPPFRLAENFVIKAMSVARRGVAILARTLFLESVGRYERVFRDMLPTYFAQFSLGLSASALILHGFVPDGSIRFCKGPGWTLLFYALKRLGLDTDPAARRPQDQQIVLFNRGAVSGDMK